MKKLSLYFLAMLFGITPFFIQSCDSDGYSLNDQVVRMATVRVVSGNLYSLEIDNGKKLWVAASDAYWYKPVDGQRVVANFTLLSDEYESYDHAIKVNFLWNVLTKQVEELTEENEETYGDDEVRIEDMWVGGNYLNIQFRFFLPNHYKHRVSLVKNTTVENPEDGYIHLEYRYNNEDDETSLMRRSLVSFNLGDYAPGEAADQYKGIKIRINSVVNGERILTYDFSKNENNRSIKNVEDIDITDDKVN